MRTASVKQLWNEVYNHVTKQQLIEVNKNISALKCKKKKKVTGGGRLCLGLASAHS